MELNSHPFVRHLRIGWNSSSTRVEAVEGMANNETKANKEKGQYLSLEQRDTDKKQSGEGDEDNLLNKDEEQHLREEREAEQELEQDTLEDEFDQKFWVDVRNLSYWYGYLDLVCFRGVQAGLCAANFICNLESIFEWIEFIVRSEWISEEQLKLAACRLCAGQGLTARQGY